MMFDLRVFCFSLVGFLGGACYSQEDSLVKDVDMELVFYSYINEFGEIELQPLKDSLWQVTITNNQGQVFDTTMKEISKESFSKIRVDEELHFLRYSLGGISFSKSKLRIIELGGYARLATECGISELYTRDFYHQLSPVSIKGDLIYSKGGPTIEGFYFKSQPTHEEGYYHVIGIFNKEPYPKGYYSTDDSPQGMFPDDGTTRYRLILEEYQLVQPERTEYKGYPVNISTGEAAIAWELAGSEAYILEGHKPWTDEEVKEKITVKGYLVQNNEGSYLKNWEIINGH